MVQPIPTPPNFAAPCVCQKATQGTDGHSGTCPRRATFAKVARELIVEKGLEGLRTRDIAKRAGINIATLHYHVPSKETLIHIIADSVRAEFIAQDAQHPRDGMNPRQKLRQEIDDFAELIAERRELLLVMAEFFDRARRDPIVRNIFVNMRTHWRQNIIQILADGVADGSFRSDIDPEAGAMIFIDALVGSSRKPNLVGDFLTLYFDQLERLFLQSPPPKLGPK